MAEGRISFRDTPESLGQFSEQELLAAIDWKKSADPRCVAAARAGDVEPFFHAIQKAWLKRFAGRKSAEKTPSTPPLALWSRGVFDDSPVSAPLVQLAEALAGLAEKPAASKAEGKSKKGGKGLESNGHAPGSNGHAAGESRVTKVSELVALPQWKRILSGDVAFSPGDLALLLELLRTRGEQLSADEFGRLWLAALVGGVTLKARFGSEWDEAASRSERVLVRGELPLAAGLLFADVKGARALAKAGTIGLREAVIDATDSQGLPRAELLERLPQALSPFVRSAALAEQVGHDLWNHKSARRFKNVLRVVVPLFRGDGRFVLGDAGDHSALPLLRTAERAAGFKSGGGPTSRLLKRHLKQAIHRSKPPRGESRAWPVAQSDKGRAAILQSDWSAAADSVVVLHHRELPQLHVTALGQSLIQGAWDLRIEIDGVPLAMREGWNCVCWFSDNDADYIELQQKYGGDLRVERQILLSRRDHFLLLADAVAGAGTSQIEYASALRLERGVDVESRVRTRECRLEGNGLQARAYPLALADDRVHSTPGQLTPGTGTLELEQTNVGGLYAPLVIDWHPKRKRGEAEWRSLTVTEQREVVRTDRASGHRLRLGDWQLLVYRSILRHEGFPRAILGHHTAHETVIGRFDASGDVAPLLMVE